LRQQLIDIVPRLAVLTEQLYFGEDSELTDCDPVSRAQLLEFAISDGGRSTS